MLEVPSLDMLQYIPNYEFLLFDPLQMSESEIQSMTSTLGLLSQCMRCKDRTELNNLVSSNERFKALDMLSAQTISHLFHINVPKKSKKQETINMCNAFQDALNYERNEGYKQGIDHNTDEIVTKMLASNTLSDEAIMQYTNISPERLLELKLKLKMV